MKSTGKSKGGKRPGAGRPRGSKTAQTKQREIAKAAVEAVAQAQAVAAIAEATQIAVVTQADLIDKEAARLAVRALVLEELRPMVAAQIANAKGIKYLIVRHKKTGKFLRVPENAAAKLDPEEEIIEVWEKDPNISAFTDLMNRAIDKPAEQPQEVKLTGEVTLVERLNAARKRLATPA